MKADVFEFTQTGRLGLLWKGVPKDQVLGWFGPPECEEMGLTQEMWKYGSVELVFANDVIDGINLRFTVSSAEGDLRKPPVFRLPPSLELEGPNLKGIRRTDFEDLLRTQDILFKVDLRYVDCSGQIRISTGERDMRVSSWFLVKPDRLLLIQWNLAWVFKEPRENKTRYRTSRG